MQLKTLRPLSARTALVSTALLVSALVVAPGAVTASRLADNWSLDCRSLDCWSLDSRSLETALPSCLDSPIVELGSSGVAGTARLCATGKDVSAQLETSNLAAGNAYTAWFVYFDRPGTCKATPCAPADVLGDDPAGVLARMDALVADDGGSAGFWGTFRGLRLSSGSQVHLPVYGHGPASTDDNRARARQLLTPEDPPLGAPGLGVPAAHPQAAPVAVAIFEIP